MKTAVKPVQVTRGRRGRWRTELKLAALQEWRNGLPVEEVCWKFRMRAAVLYRWRHTVERGLKEPGDLVPRTRTAALQKRIDELERALGRNAIGTRQTALAAAVGTISLTLFAFARSKTLRELA